MNAMTSKNTINYEAIDIVTVFIYLLLNYYN